MKHYLYLFLMMIITRSTANAVTLYKPQTNDYLYTVILGLYSNDAKLNSGGMFDPSAMTNLNLAGFAVSNGVYYGDGSGLTNLHIVSIRDYAVDENIAPVSGQVLVWRTSGWTTEVAGAEATNVTWANILETPTDLSGFGITDAYTKIESDALYATGTPLYGYTETDPIWTGQSGAVWAAIGSATNAGGATIIALGGNMTSTISRASGPELFVNLETNDGTKTLNIAADMLDVSVWSRLLIHYAGTNSLAITVTNTGTTAGWPVALTNGSGIIFWDKPQGTQKRCINVFQQYR